VQGATAAAAAAFQRTPAASHGATGAADPLTAPITQHTTLGHLNTAFSAGFLPSATGSSTGKQGTAPLASSGQTSDALAAHTGALGGVLAGTLANLKPSLAAGDRLDLSHALAGAPLAHDLTNVGGVVTGLSRGLHPQGSSQAGKSTVENTGAAGQPVPQTHGSGKLDVVDLLKHNPLIPPSS
jgi:hypothetical protein